jgi:hypothetical protein
MRGDGQNGFVGHFVGSPFRLLSIYIVHETGGIVKMFGQEKGEGLKIVLSNGGTVRTGFQIWVFRSAINPNLKSEVKVKSEKVRCKTFGFVHFI